MTRFLTIAALAFTVLAGAGAAHAAPSNPHFQDVPGWAQQALSNID